MKQRVKYEINSYGNEYYSSTSFAKTYKDALLKYNAEIECAKHLNEDPLDPVPEHVYISIKNLVTCKIVKYICINLD